METYGFHFRYRLCGAPPTIREFYFKDTETLTAGDLVNLESGEVDLAATNDTGLLGAVVETLSGTDSTTKIKVIVDADAVYAVTDANARNMGAQLDIAGTTGAMTVATDSNHDVVVAANSSATEPTLVMIVQGEHPLF
jgi:hypothetical protein